MALSSDSREVLPNIFKPWSADALRNERSSPLRPRFNHDGFATVNMTGVPTLDRYSLHATSFASNITPHRRHILGNIPSRGVT